MDSVEAMAAGMVVMQHLNTVTTAAAAIGESCCVAPFEGRREDSQGREGSTSCWDKRGSLSPNVLKDFRFPQLDSLYDDTT